LEPATIVADAGCKVIAGAAALLAAVVDDDEDDESEPPLHADNSSDSEVA
jgi:hypothetical protein